MTMTMHGAGHDASFSISGSANSRKRWRFSMSRRTRASRGSSRIFRAQCRRVHLILAAEPLEPPAPALDAADDGGLHEEPLHFHGARSVPATTAASVSAFSSPSSFESPPLPVCPSSSPLPAPREPRSPRATHRPEGRGVYSREVAIDPRSQPGTWPSERYSAKREAEQALNRTCEKRQKGAPSWMRSPDATIEQAGIPARESACPAGPGNAGSAQQDRHLVEPYARSSFIEDETRDLRAFAPFARRGKPLHVTGRCARGWLSVAKQIPAKMLQVRIDLCRLVWLFDGTESRDAARPVSSPAGTVTSAVEHTPISARAKSRSAGESPANPTPRRDGRRRIPRRLRSSSVATRNNSARSTAEAVATGLRSSPGAPPDRRPLAEWS